MGDKLLVWLHGEVKTPPREDRQLTQLALARLLGSSQSRVAKMEAGDPSVSLDLLIRAAFAIGTTPAQLGAVIASTPEQPRPIDTEQALDGRELVPA